MQVTKQNPKVYSRSINTKTLNYYKKLLTLDELRNKNLLIQQIGEMVAVGIYSPNLKEIEEQYNSWYNWNATSGDLHWLNDTKEPYFAYIISTAARYVKYLFNVLENRFARKTNLELENKTHYSYLKTIAKEEIRKIRTDIFLRTNIFETYVYKFPENGYIPVKTDTGDEAMKKLKIQEIEEIYA